MGWWGKKMLNVLGAAPSDIRVVRAVEPNLDTVRAICAEKGVNAVGRLRGCAGRPRRWKPSCWRRRIRCMAHRSRLPSQPASTSFAKSRWLLTKAGAEKAVRLCRDAGLVLGMGHERRWEPPIAEMLAKADAGELGRMHQIEANFSHDKFLALDRDNWRLKADQAPAGGMTATGIHLLDLSVRLLGPAESVLVHLRTALVGSAAGRHRRRLRQVSGRRHVLRLGLARQPLRVALRRLWLEGLDRHSRQGACRGARRLDRHICNGRRPDHDG